MSKKKLLGFLVFFLILLIIPFGFWLNRDQPVEEKPTADYFSLVVLPDTQYYSQNYPEIFMSQTRWILENKEEWKIAFVSHVGDITQTKGVEKEWENASRAMRLLEGSVPYGLAPGNHDDLEMFNEYFPFTRYLGNPWWGGHYGRSNNSNYQFFTAQGMAFLIVHLENEPSEKVLAWADRILKRYPEKRAMVVSHSIVDYGGFRTEAGERIFEALKDNENLFLMLCGHIHSEEKRVDYVEGRPIYQLLADYQARANGGNGWLRILKFIPEEDKIQVRTYSPWLNEFESDENSEFGLEYKMSH